MMPPASANEPPIPPPRMHPSLAKAPPPRPRRMKSSRGTDAAETSQPRASVGGASTASAAKEAGASRPPSKRRSPSPSPNGGEESEDHRRRKSTDPPADLAADLLLAELTKIDAEGGSDAATGGKEGGNGSDSGADSWMEDALLRGITAANRGEGQADQPQDRYVPASGGRGGGSAEVGDSDPPPVDNVLDLSDKSTKELLGEIFDDMDAADAATALGMPSGGMPPPLGRMKRRQVTTGSVRPRSGKATSSRKPRRKSAEMTMLELGELGDALEEGEEDKQSSRRRRSPYRRKSSTFSQSTDRSSNPSRRKSERELAELDYFERELAKAELDHLGMSDRSGGGSQRGSRRRNAKKKASFKRSSSSGGVMPELVLAAMEENNGRGGSASGSKQVRRGSSATGGSGATIAELTNPDISIDDLLRARKREATNGNNSHPKQISTSVMVPTSTGGSKSPQRQRSSRRSRHDAEPPPDDLPGIPALPIIKTYKVTKNRPDEPAGLFLTKAKNGAVLVHSLSPESLFRSTPLHPGQEVLSVNEKRVNDPKMAATLITQAKKTLGLRVSTVERSRGFMYCQVKRRGGGGEGGAAANADAGKSHPAGRHGVRFATTSVDGVRRGTVTEGLVRVSHVDPAGLFAASHPMNRLRVGSIVVTINGAPVTNGRSALEKVMGSAQLIEVLHCDERVWRADWVKDGLGQVLAGEPQRDPMEIAVAIFSKKDGVDKQDNNKQGGEEKKGEDSSEKNLDNDDNPWDLEWTEERDECIMRREGDMKSSLSSLHEQYGFKLVFDNDVGTCHPELVDDDTMMPPADEFDVSLLVKVVNDSQRTMMTVLQNMLRRAKFEMKNGSRRGRASSKPSREDPKEMFAASLPAGKLDSKAASLRKLNAKSLSNLSHDRANSKNLLSELIEENELSGGDKKPTGNRPPKRLARSDRANSLDLLSELVEGELGGVDEELSKLAQSLLRVDARDRKRHTLRASDTKKQVEPKAGHEGRIQRRASAGVAQALAELSAADIEEWRMEKYEKEAVSTDKAQDKIQEFAHRQHMLEEQYEEHNRSRPRNDMEVDTPRQDTLQQSRHSIGSMFSMDMIGDFLEYLEDVDAQSFGQGDDGASTPSSTTYNREESSPPSPRDDNDDHIEEMTLCISPTEQLEQGGESKEAAPTEETKKGSDEMAYITGVWRDVGSKYEISDKIVGSGGFGEVRDCYDKKTGQVYVVKTIFKPAQDDTTKINLIRNEILLLHEAHHPNIVELRDLFEDDKYVHIVMERCTGGDLFDRVVAENPRRLRTMAEAMRHEARTASSMRSILQVLKYLHSKGIVHRDIKPEHFLLTTEDKETQKIKLIDFGLARKHKPGSAPMTTFTGSPSFVAPEVIARRYDHMCDMFSTGVTAYFLLTGMLPFDGPTDEKTFDLISAGKFKFPSSSIFLSEDAKDFVTKLLRTDPKKRMSASKALSHPWLLKAASC